MKEQYNLFENNDIKLDWVTIENGTILPLDSSGELNACVMTANNEPVGYSIEDYDPEMPFTNMYLTPDFEDATVLYGGYFNRHWGHFLVDVLPQLWPLFGENAPQVDKIVFVAANAIDMANVSANILACFKLLGVSEKVEIISKPRSYSRIIVPGKAFLPRQRAATEALNVYNAIVNKAERVCASTKSAGMHRRLYLSRKHLAKSKLNEPNSDWLDGFFEENGFKVIYPEKIPLEQTIGLIRNAEIVAAMSGTLPHNMVFARPGQQLWIIEKTAITNNFQPGIDSLRQLDVTPIDANALIWTVSAGLGPFIIYPNHIFLRFCADKGLKAPDVWRDGQKRRVLARYIQIFHRHYGRQWVMDEWEEIEIASMREAWRDTMADFGDFIRSEKAITIADMLSPRRLAKRLYHTFRKS